MLVGYSSGTVVMWDAAGHCAMSKFDRCIVGLAGIRWMAWAPGNFLALRSACRSIKLTAVDLRFGFIKTTCLTSLCRRVRVRLATAWSKSLLYLSEPEATSGSFE